MVYTVHDKKGLSSWILVSIQLCMAEFDEVQTTKWIVSASWYQRSKD